MAATMTFRVRRPRPRRASWSTGKIEADSPGRGRRPSCKSMGYAPVSINEARRGGMKTEITLPGFGAKVKLKDLAIFSRQFATMINSGLSLLRALTILAEQTENKELAKVLGRGPQRRRGRPVAVRRRWPSTREVFPPLMVNMTRAGEVGGFLDAVLLQIAENYEAEVKLRGKIKSAMTYPVVVFCHRDPRRRRHAAVHRAGLRGDVHRRSAASCRLPTQILVTMSQRPEDRLPRLIVVG